MTSQSTSLDNPATGPNRHGDEIAVGVDYSAELPLGRPPLRDECVLHGEDPLAVDQPNVIIRQSAAEQVEAHSQSNTRVELGGVLLGNVYTHNNQIFVDVVEAIPARSVDNGPIHFTFTADVWRQLQADMAHFPDLKVVGWFHTHPDLGVFFSADDEVVHAAAFTQPWHVGLVVDPVRNEASFFGWWQEAIVPLSGFYELLPAESEAQLPTSVIDWSVHVSEWHGGMGANSRFAAMTDYAPNRSAHGGYAKPSLLPPISPWVGAILGGLGFITGLTALILIWTQQQ